MPIIMTVLGELIKSSGIDFLKETKSEEKTKKKLTSADKDLQSKLFRNGGKTEVMKTHWFCKRYSSLSALKQSLISPEDDTPEKLILRLDEI